MSSESISFSEHINELRSRLKTVFISFLIIFIIVVFFPSDPIYSIQHPGQYLDLSFISHTVVSSVLKNVVHDVLPQGWQLIAAGGIGEGMEIYFIASLIISVALDLPVIAYETFRFVDPALTENERRMIYPFVIASSALFVAGVFFGYYVIAKFLILALAPFFQAAQIYQAMDAASFYYVVFLVVGISGLSFTTPVFVYTLIVLNVISADFFSKNRVIIWFIVWAVTGLFLTPDGGPLLDIVIFIPIITMLEVAVYLAKKRVSGNLRNENKCKFCGSRLNERSIFCPRCGKANS